MGDRVGCPLTVVKVDAFDPVTPPPARLWVYLVLPRQPRVVQTVHTSDGVAGDDVSKYGPIPTFETR